MHCLVGTGMALNRWGMVRSWAAQGVGQVENLGEAAGRSLLAMHQAHTG